MKKVRRLDRKVRKELIRLSGKDSDAKQAVRDYITFLETRPTLPENTKGTDVHHILPRALFPQFAESKWNLIRLTRQDHIRASSRLVEIDPTQAGLLRGLIVTSTSRGAKRSGKSYELGLFIKIDKSLLKMVNREARLHRLDRSKFVRKALFTYIQNERYRVLRVVARGKY